MRYNPNIHHRRSLRLQGYDYAQAGLYFITICTHRMAHVFGRITDGRMTLNDAGKIADACWAAIPDHFPNAVLHEYVVMPNHVHGIIELVGVVGAENLLPLQQPPHRNEFQKMIPRSVCSMVKGFKIGVTKWFRNNTDTITVWQRNYYEHIIRDARAYRNIAAYIRNNPANWKSDRFYR